MENDNDVYELYLQNVKYNCGKEKLEKNYVYENQIGQGAYGYVMCGYRRNDHCSVAIKVLPSDRIIDWYYSKELQKNIPMEVLLLAITSNIDGVITILEYFHDENDSKWFIVMERFSNAIDLFEFISSTGLLSESLACHVFHQLALSVIDCHLRGVLHRDIKEENILIDTNTKKVWLIDFGSGGLMNDDNHHIYNGTSEYAPPEWLIDKHYRGCQLESWSLGIVLYSMIFGAIPFDDEKQIISGVIRFPRNISNNCKDLISKCLERDPKIRIQPFEMITHPWISSTLNQYDSGHGSFDEAYLENLNEKRRCSCSCAENATAYSKDENSILKSTIETLDYDTECIKQINCDWRFRVFSKSLSLDLGINKDLISPHYLFITNKKKTFNKSVSVMDLHSDQSEILFDKLNDIFAEKDDGYDDDGSSYDDFPYDDESIVLSNDFYSIEA